MPSGNKPLPDLVLVTYIYNKLHCGKALWYECPNLANELHVLSRYRQTSITGLALGILKMESWTHMGCTANMIIKDIIHIFASISKNMHILLMERCYRECCNIVQTKSHNLYVSREWRWRFDGVFGIWNNSIGGNTWQKLIAWYVTGISHLKSTLFNIC